MKCEEELAEQKNKVENLEENAGKTKLEIIEETSQIVANLTTTVERLKSTLAARNHRILTLEKKISETFGENWKASGLEKMRLDIHKILDQNYKVEEDSVANRLDLPASN